MCFAYQLPKNDNTRKNAHFTPPIVFIDSQKKKSAQTSINLSGYLFAIFCVSFSPFFYFVFCFFFIKTCRAAIWHTSCNFFPYKNCYSIIIFFFADEIGIKLFSRKIPYNRLFCVHIARSVIVNINTVTEICTEVITNETKQTIKSVKANGLVGATKTSFRFLFFLSSQW